MGAFHKSEKLFILLTFVIQWWPWPRHRGGIKQTFGQESFNFCMTASKIKCLWIDVTETSCGCLWRVQVTFSSSASERRKAGNPGSFSRKLSVQGTCSIACYLILQQRGEKRQGNLLVKQLTKQLGVRAPLLLTSRRFIYPPARLPASCWASTSSTLSPPRRNHSLPQLPQPPETTSTFRVRTHMELPLTESTGTWCWISFHFFPPVVFYWRCCGVTG